MKFDKNILRIDFPFDEKTENELYVSYVKNFVLKDADSIEFDYFTDLIIQTLSINCDIDNIREYFNTKHKNNKYYEYFEYDHDKIYVTPKGQILIIEKLRKEFCK